MMNPVLEKVVRMSLKVAAARIVECDVHQILNYQDS